MTRRRVTALLARYGIPSVISAVLLLTFSLYRFSYFWIDDFNTLFWVQREGFVQKILHIVDMRKESFRPIGMLACWSMDSAFGL